MNGSNNQNEYWGSYYGKQEVPVLPSQFALFVGNELATGEISPVASIFDIGCGNGRDAMFFAQLGYQVRGLDASEAAIVACKERLDQVSPGQAARAAFMAGPADTPGSWAELTAGTEGAALVYARFFFHAIDDETELTVLDQIAQLLRARGGAFCAEFRTPADRDAAKVTPQHYRRFIELGGFAERVARTGLKAIWQAEGRGMAKYRQDDAHVGRLIAVV